MAQIEARKRKNGSITYYVRWIDPDTRQRMTQKMDSRESAEFLHTVLTAHGGDVGGALNAAREYYGGVYTVTRMIEDHIGLLTSANGYTVRRYKANLKSHIAQTLGTTDAARVEYRDIVSWIKGMQDKGLSSKTIANVHGLISAAFNAMVRDKRRPDNPCKGVSLPKSEATEETATFLTRAEWDLVEGELAEPYRTFFTFLIHTGLRFSEATALEARDFQTNPSGQHVVNVVRAWTKDEDNVSYIGPTKTRQSKRTVALTAGAYSLIHPLLTTAKAGSPVFLNTAGSHMDHRRAWGVWDRAVVKAKTKGLTKRPRIHDLRHSNASWLLHAGLDIYKLQKHLGHKSITTTLDRYSHLLPEALSDTTAAMNRAFGSGA
ncbi:site-specific integrase [Arthrobacter sp. KBS0703]|uniref:tyrosine-type recombinase/integrase n=1 Tax=Arthrobacter sp. KBS0703 TaxID=1955698 RepID=UPI00098E91D2|nr:site-specific integrase [Arthrobacter sp. KBS0703]TSE15668.1 site-specific integrase [Arthrobacter sp. KBS0703]